jgi:hypothetical protein
VSNGFIKSLKAHTEKMYYNTTNEKQPELGLAWNKTIKQDDMVKKIFDSNPNGLTAYECHQIYLSHGFNCPLTSIRRSVTCLMNEGYLEMTEDLRMGGYGAKNFVYKKK